MSQPPEQSVDTGEQTYCYRHPETPTGLSCTRCGRPICWRCATPATVGQHCPECVAEARRTQRPVRSAMGATAPVVMAIIAANVIVFLLQRAQGAEFTQRFGTFAPEIADGEYWRLITAMFLHAPTFIFHILFNMLVLWIYGPQVEQAVGSVRFTALYFVSGFFASATSYALGSCNTLGVGASGAIFGIVGILLVYAYNRRRSAFVAAYFRNLLAFVGINLVFGLAIAGIDVWAHGGGLAAGVVLGWGFDRSGPRALAAQAATLLLVAGAGVALVAWRTATILC